MQKFKTLADAKALAEFAHRNQLDKAGEPYIEHPMRVLATVQAQGVQPFVQIAAVFHDVPEDTAFSHEILLALGFSEAAIVLTRLLDRDESELLWRQQGGGHGMVMDSDEYKDARDEFYYTEIKKDRNATIIKLADIRDNMSPWRQVYLEPKTQTRLRKKYAKALDILNPKPVNHGFISDPYAVHDPYHLR